MAGVVWFDGPGASDVSLVGGKAANLAVLAGAGFRVPAGFTITTEAYQEFVAGIQGGIDAELATVDYQDPDQVEKVTGRIREIIMGAPVPAGIRAGIEQAYGELSVPLVAVRSSGTAEDLAEASFAGLHDTYLDITGADEVLRAVQRCWASMWTARATAYRRHQGFDHQSVGIAVVVQTMIDAEVSGVMFTANPLTTATNEIVINASYGLGEAIVQGIASPDEYVVETDTLLVKRHVIGAKEVRIVRDPVSGRGTVTQSNPIEDRQNLSMDVRTAADLAAVGCEVMQHYGSIPQDIEWALADGTFHILQARPITGVEFSWDADLEYWQTADDDDSILWTRKWADEVWTGAISPLMYSLRGRTLGECYHEMGNRLGIPEMSERRVFMFHKGGAYYNCEIEKIIQIKTWMPWLRDAQYSMLQYIPEDWQRQVLEAPFSYWDYLKMQARLMAVAPQNGVYRWFGMMDEYITMDKWDMRHLPDPTTLSDAVLKRTIRKYFNYEWEYNDDFVTPMLTWPRDALQILALIVTHWYSGSEPTVFADLLMGTRGRSKTIEENLALYGLAKQVRESESLRELFDDREGAAFFEAVEGRPEFADFLAEYRQFIANHGHRGNEDRDLYYPRRYEDPGIDYRAIRTLLTLDESVDPEIREHETNDRREAVYERVLADIQRQPLGFLKGEAFKIAYHYVHRFIVVRDDERWSYERFILGIKLLCKEMGRRLHERGLLDHDDDYLFLGEEELYHHIDGKTDVALMKRKAAARRRDFERILHREKTLPLFLQAGQPVAADTVNEGGLRGTARSGGVVTATARVIKRLEDAHRVAPGEIMVCNATDPGWTAVFMLISGIITETGGVLSHASCLSREYGLPCVQLPDAMTLIPDGVTITIDGDTGLISIDESADPDV